MSTASQQWLTFRTASTRVWESLEKSWKENFLTLREMRTKLGKKRMIHETIKLTVNETQDVDMKHLQSVLFHSKLTPKVSMFRFVLFLTV